MCKHESHNVLNRNGSALVITKDLLPQWLLQTLRSSQKCTIYINKIVSNSFLFLVVGPGAPGSVLAPSSDANSLEWPWTTSLHGVWQCATMLPILSAVMNPKWRHINCVRNNRWVSNNKERQNNANSTRTRNKHSAVQSPTKKSDHRCANEWSHRETIYDCDRRTFEEWIELILDSQQTWVSEPSTTRTPAKTKETKPCWCWT